MAIESPFGQPWIDGGFGIYVHWPFCASKCPYCDFNSHVRASVDHAVWADALCQELRSLARGTEGRTVRSIYFGGGTPSLMVPETIDAIISQVRALWPTSNQVEITLETNPSSFEREKFLSFQNAGVNRVSIGVQSLGDGDLALLGRRHSVAEALSAIDAAQNIYERVSFDLIYARQHQSLEDWRAELDQALSLGVDHLSLYQLTIEPGTAFFERRERGGLRGLPDEELAADFYELTQDACAQAGLVAYEVSNHARPGAESQHNLIYWRQGDWIGIGPGAHGRISLGAGRYGTEATALPEQWLAEVERRIFPQPMALEPADFFNEYLMMGLRMNEGCDLARLRQTGIAPPLDAISRLEDLGLLTLEDDHLTVTASGRLVLNAVLRELLV